MEHAAILNDGKQTPLREHPVFVAQHVAAGCCCRDCLEKWRGILKERNLSVPEQENIPRMLKKWLEFYCP